MVARMLALWLRAERVALLGDHHQRQHDLD
jgi:hypothetical protein